MEKILELTWNNERLQVWMDPETADGELRRNDTEIDHRGKVEDCLTALLDIMGIEHALRAVCYLLWAGKKED